MVALLSVDGMDESKMKYPFSESTNTVQIQSKQQGLI